MISAIVAAKNAEKTISLAIRSLLFSLSKEDEVLVMLDGCEDATQQVLAKIKDPRLKIFSSTKSKGRSEARNYLAARARGEVLAVLDADDVSLPWRFKIAKKQLQGNDAVFGTALVFGRQLSPVFVVPQIPRTISAEEMPLECLGRNPLVHSSATFRKSALEGQIPYRDSEAEEYDLWLRFINSGKKVFRSAIPVVMYRFHQGQASQTPGFIERGLNCRLVQDEQRKLALTLGIEVGDIVEVRRIATSGVAAKGLFAKMEVLGLSGLKAAIRGLG